MSGERTVLCFGDSNTWGYEPGAGARYPRAVRWTGVLAAELGASWHVVEAGLNGRTTVFDDPLGDKKGLREVSEQAVVAEARARVGDPPVAVTDWTMSSRVMAEVTSSAGGVVSRATK